MPITPKIVPKPVIITFFLLGLLSSLAFRAIILFRAGKRAYFVHGFAKNEQDNIRDDELAAFKMLAARLLAYDDAALAKVIAAGTLMEVMRDD